jgi:hypothetical protein
MTCGTQYPVKVLGDLKEEKGSNLQMLLIKRHHTHKIHKTG